MRLITGFWARRLRHIARAGRRTRTYRIEPSVIGVVPFLTAGEFVAAIALLGEFGTEYVTRVPTSAAMTTWEFALVGILFVLVCTLFVLRLSESVSTRSTDDERSSAMTDGLVGSNESTVAFHDSETEGAPSNVITESFTDQDRIVQFLVENDGRIRQQQIVERTDWSKSKVSRLLSRMEENGTIEKVPVGRENIIRLTTPDEPTYATITDTDHQSNDSESD